MSFQHGADAIGRLPAVHARPKGAHFPALFHVLNRPRQPFIVQPAVFPGVELHQVDRLESQVFQTPLDIFLDIHRWVAIIQRKVAAARPAAILGRNFCGHVQMFVGPADRGIPLELPDDLSKYLFAFSISVSPRGIKKVAAKLDSAAQRRHGLPIVGPRPARKPPHTVTNFADVPPRPPKPPVIHRCHLLSCEAIVAKAPVARESHPAPLSICPPALGMPQ